MLLLGSILFFPVCDIYVAMYVAHHELYIASSYSYHYYILYVATHVHNNNNIIHSCNRDN